MKIRRYPINYVFNTLENTRLHPDAVGVEAKFICIPRYNVCVHLRASSIRFFFNYIYKVRTYKTYLIWGLLRIVGLVPRLHAVLNKFGLNHEIKSVSASQNIDWKRIDVLYIEWHFFGVFSKSESTVTHVLAKKAYKERFLNELSARSVGTQFKNLSKVFPKLLKVSKNPKFYVEELAADSGKQLITNAHLIKAQKKIKKLNRKTLKTILLDNYHNELINQLGSIKNEKLSRIFINLNRAIEQEYVSKSILIKVALAHGDFNAGQVLSKNNHIKIIDWGDGGILNRYFDYITICMYKSPDHKFNTDSFPKELAILNAYFSKKFENENYQKLYILLSLLEIFVISKGEFENEEGAYLRWIQTVENNI